MKKLLLDTHALLWYLGNHPNLPMNWRNLIEAPENEVSVSVASLWEIAIKTSLGKLTLAFEFGELVSILQRQQIEILPITPTQLEVLLTLPFHHRDPFDRLIIAQAKILNLTLLSADENFPHYSIELLTV